MEKTVPTHAARTPSSAGDLVPTYGADGKNWAAEEGDAERAVVGCETELRQDESALARAARMLLGWNTRPHPDTTQLKDGFGKARNEATRGAARQVAGSFTRAVQTKFSAAVIRVRNSAAKLKSAMTNLDFTKQRPPVLPAATFNISDD